MLYPPGGGVGTPATICAISTRGCLIECAKAPAVGKKCELYLESEATPFGFEAQAIYVDADGRTGLKFLKIDSESRKRLEGLCESLQLGARSPSAEDEDAGGAVAPSEPYLGILIPSTDAPPLRKPAPTRERRRVPRYISELQASVSHPPSGTTSSVALITLSVLGGCLEGADVPGSGEACEVITNWEGRALRLSGKVVWKVGQRAGVKFEALDETTERLLRQICASLRLQPLAPLPPEPE